MRERFPGSEREAPAPVLILVRHAAPALDPATPPGDWALSPSGLAAAHRLGERLAPYRPRRIVSSPEAKALATARALAAPDETVDVDAGLREHARRHAPYLDDATFEATITRVLTEPDRLVYGEETGAAARARFAAAIATELAATPAAVSLVIVTHGTVLSLYLAQLAGIDPVPFWQALGLPAYAVLTRPDLALLAVVNDLSDELLPEPVAG